MTTPTKNDNREVRSMPTIPDDFVSYKKTPMFTQDSVPDSLQKDHSTASEIWAQIIIEKGSLKYNITEPGFEGEYLLNATNPGVISAGHTHFIEPVGSVSFYIEFYRKA